MEITFQHLISLLPLLIVGLTVVVVILCIAWRQRHIVNATLTIMGLSLAFLSLWFVSRNGAMHVTPLINVDGFSMFYTGLILIASLATSALAYAWLAGYPDNRDEFYLLILIATMGGILLTCANHLASLFLGIELISLLLFGMTGYAYCQNKSLEASIKYTLLSVVASSFLLFGIGLVYASTGQLSFIAIRRTLNDALLYQPLLLAGLGMLIVGFGFKLSLVPFHLWTPDVYQGAPAPASTFLATVSKIAIYVVLMRFFLYVPVTDYKVVRLVLMMIACCSILFGNLLSLSQNSIKRMLGYSSIAHLGYLLVGLITVPNHTLALETTGVYLTAYLLSTLGAFGIISLMSSPYSGEDADSLCSYRGLFWHKPILSVVMTIMMLSLAGIPMTLGFIGKFYVIFLCVNTNLWWLTGAVVVGSAIGLFYYLRIVVNLYRFPLEKQPAFPLFDWVLTAGGVVVLIAFCLVLLLGFYPQPLITLVKLATPLL